MLRLWAHQEEAVRAACAGLPGGGRATVVAACGTGKTVTGAEVSRRLAPGGRVLVVVPTLELLSQTARGWVGFLGGGAGQVIGVCSDAGAADDAAAALAQVGGLRAEVTSDPAAVAGVVAGGGRVTVVCTYASLPVIAAAHGRHGAPGWDLLVADEAHRSAGNAGRVWGMLHFDEVIPAARRLYMTATPRIMPGAGEHLISMDDEAVFGPVVHRLPFARAIADGLLADYRVVVAVVTDAEAAKLAAGQLVEVGGQAVPARVAAAQVALARAIGRWDLRRVITYHRRVAAARQFAATLPATIGVLEVGERPARPVRADYVTGAMSRAARRQRLALLGDPGAGVSVVANARVLAEGVDVPALDGVMFADPKESVIDTVQAVGRALRRGQGAGKVATIIVPVLVADGADPAAAAEGSEFDVVWQVVRALRAHDERIAGQLDGARAQLGCAVAPAAAGGDGEDPQAGMARWLQVTGAPVTAGFARAIQVRTVTAATTSWPQWHAALAEYHATHGHARVPQGYRAPAGLALGGWLASQRQLRAAGQLPGDREAALDALGVIWQPQQQTWAQGLAHATAYHTTHGHLDIPRSHRSSGGFRLGEWLAERRRDYRRGDLAPARAGALEALGVQWDTASGAAWQRSLDLLARYRDVHGHAQVPVSYTDPATGYRLGTWLAVQRMDHRRGQLPADRAAALEQLGVAWETASTSWDDGLAHLARYRDTYGHARVPATYTDPADGYPLGAWVARMRAIRRNPGHRRTRRRPLSSDEIAALDQLGMIWDATRRAAPS